MDGAQTDSRAEPGQGGGQRGDFLGFSPHGESDAVLGAGGTAANNIERKGASVQHVAQ